MKKKELENLLHLIKTKFNIIVVYNKESQEYDIRCMELEKIQQEKIKGALMLEKEIERLQTQNRLLQAELAPFRDDYFKDLDGSQVAELAKKSIRITRENREIQDLLNDIYEESRYKTVLSFNVYSKLAKFVKEHKLEEL